MTYTSCVVYTWDNQGDGCWKLLECVKHAERGVGSKGWHGTHGPESPPPHTHMMERQVVMRAQRPADACGPHKSESTAPPHVLECVKHAERGGLRAVSALNTVSK